MSQPSAVPPFVSEFVMKRALVSTCVAFLLSAGAEAQTLQAVKFAWNPNPQTAQVDVALKNGLFKEAGLDVQTIAFPTGREALEALIGGQVDFAYMAEFPVATAALRKQKIQVVADLARYRGQRIIASAKFLDLKATQDLAGKKLGTTLGTNVEYFTHRLLTKTSLKATVVNAGPADLVPALVRGDIDAAIMFPTFFGAARKTLGDDYRELVSDEYILHMIISTSAATVEKAPEMIDKFAAALVKADVALAADVAGAKQAVITNMKGVMPAAELDAMWAQTEYKVKLDDDLLVLLADQAGWIVDRGMVKADKPSAASFREFVREAPLKKADPARVTLR
jgi:ABC-type nitrate/sulfonate/bicarbonate transport system substrate-binding protein